MDSDRDNVPKRNLFRGECTHIEAPMLEKMGITKNTIRLFQELQIPLEETDFEFF